MTIQEILQNKDYQGLPEQERRKVWESLFDKQYGNNASYLGLPDTEKVRARSMYANMVMQNDHTPDPNALHDRKVTMKKWREAQNTERRANLGLPEFKLPGNIDLETAANKAPDKTLTPGTEPSNFEKYVASKHPETDIDWRKSRPKLEAAGHNATFLASVDQAKNQRSADRAITMYTGNERRLVEMAVQRDSWDGGEQKEYSRLLNEQAEIEHDVPRLAMGMTERQYNMYQVGRDMIRDNPVHTYLDALVWGGVIRPLASVTHQFMPGTFLSDMTTYVDQGISSDGKLLGNMFRSTLASTPMNIMLMVAPMVGVPMTFSEINFMGIKQDYDAGKLDAAHIATNIISSGVQTVIEFASAGSQKKVYQNVFKELGKEGLERAVKKDIRNMLFPTAKGIARNLWTGSWTEGLEEVQQDIADRVIRNIMLNEPMPSTTDDLKAWGKELAIGFAGGALGGFLMGGGASVVQVHTSKQMHNFIQHNAGRYESVAQLQKAIEQTHAGADVETIQALREYAVNKFAETKDEFSDEGMGHFIRGINLLDAAIAAHKEKAVGEMMAQNDALSKDIGKLQDAESALTEQGVKPEAGTPQGLQLMSLQEQISGKTKELRKNLQEIHTDKHLSLFYNAMDKVRGKLSAQDKVTALGQAQEQAAVAAMPFDAEYDPATDAGKEIKAPVMAEDRRREQMPEKKALTTNAISANDATITTEDGETNDSKNPDRISGERQERQTPELPSADTKSGEETGSGNDQNQETPGGQDGIRSVGTDQKEDDQAPKEKRGDYYIIQSKGRPPIYALVTSEDDKHWHTHDGKKILKKNKQGGKVDPLYWSNQKSKSARRSAGATKAYNTRFGDKHIISEADLERMPHLRLLQGLTFNKGDSPFEDIVIRRGVEMIPLIKVTKGYKGENFDEVLGRASEKSGSSAQLRALEESDPSYILEAADKEWDFYYTHKTALPYDDAVVWLATEAEHKALAAQQEEEYEKNNPSFQEIKARIQEGINSLDHSAEVFEEDNPDIDHNDISEVTEESPESIESEGFEDEKNLESGLEKAFDEYGNLLDENGNVLFRTGENKPNQPNISDSAAEEALIGLFRHQVDKTERDGRKLAISFKDGRKLTLNRLNEGYKVTLSDGRKLDMYGRTYSETIDNVFNVFVDLVDGLNGGNRTLYHEAFHVAWKLFLTPDQINILTRYYAKKLNLDVNQLSKAELVDIEEAAANGAQDWLGNRAEVPPGIRTIFKRFWDRVRNALVKFGLATQDQRIEDIFWRLESGKLEGKGTEDRAGATNATFSQEKSDTKTRYRAVEEKNLVTIHNLEIANLEKTISRGGMPMPSIAIVDIDKTNHKEFGDVSLIASPEMLDVSRKNPVYTQDAWTPNYPNIRHEVSKESWSQLREVIKAIQSFVPEAKGEGLGGLTELYLEQNINDKGYERALYWYLDSYWDNDNRNMGNNEAHHKRVSRKAKQLAAKYPVKTTEMIRTTNDRNGNARYIPNTLENVLKHMERQRSDESSIHAINQLIGKLSPKLTSIDQIKKNRGRLTTKDGRQEVYNRIQQKIKEVAAFAKEQRKQFNWWEEAQVIEDIYDIETRGLGFVRTEYKPGTDFSKFFDVINEIKAQPSDIFEAKPRRIIRLNEFTAAVIPTGTKASTAKALREAGLKVVKYEAGNDEARFDAVKKVSEKMGLRYKLADPEVNAKFNEDVERHFTGGLPERHVFELGNPGAILNKVGMEDVPIRLMKDILGVKTDGHDLAKEHLLNLPQAINDPIMIAKLHGNNTFDIITNIDHPEGKLLVAIGYRREETGAWINSIKTIFGKNQDSLTHWITNKEKAKRIVYLNAEKILSVLAISSETNSQPIQQVAKDIDKINESVGLSSAKFAEVREMLEQDSTNRNRLAPGDQAKALVSDDNYASPYRYMYPKVRGGWTKDKIKRTLMQSVLKWRSFGVQGVLREIAAYDNADDFANHIFYHGTAGIIDGGLKPSIGLSTRKVNADSFGGGYGERYWSASVSKSKNIASNFSGTSSGVNVYPVLLKKGAKVISRPDIKDAAEIEDIIVDLWDQGVDAVIIGDWSSEYDEQELSIINPFAAYTYNNAVHYRAFGKPKLNNLSSEEIKALYNQAMQMRETGKNTDEDIKRNIRYKLADPEVNARFNGEIDDLFNSKITGHHVFALGNPGEILVGAGIPERPIQVLKGTLRRKIKRHGLTKEQLKDLPMHLNDPIFVMISLTEEKSMTVFTEIEHRNGNILVAIDIDRTHNHLQVNDIRSLHGKSSSKIMAFLQNEGDSFTFINKEKSLDYLFRVNGSNRQMPEQISKAIDKINESVGLSSAKFAKVREMLEQDGTNRNRLAPNTAEIAEAERQMEEVREQYEGTDKWMKAPNGKPTKLNERQWLQVRTPAFKSWFGDWENDPKSASKVVDENGEPMVVYHGTGKSFTEFNLDKTGGVGFYFALDPESAEFFGKIRRYEGSDTIYPVFLNIRNGNVSSTDKKTSEQGNLGGNPNKIINSRLKDMGYDGIVKKGEIITFSPTQIKSATGNTGAFDPQNPDIRYRIQDDDLDARLKAAHELLKRYQANLNPKSASEMIANEIAKAKNLDPAQADDKIGRMIRAAYREGEGKAKEAMAAFAIAEVDKVIDTNKPDGSDKKDMVLHMDEWDTYAADIGLTETDAKTLGADGYTYFLKGYNMYAYGNELAHQLNDKYAEKKAKAEQGITDEALEKEISDLISLTADAMIHYKNMKTNAGRLLQSAKHEKHARIKQLIKVAEVITETRDAQIAEIAAIEAEMAELNTMAAELEKEFELLLDDIERLSGSRYKSDSLDELRERKRLMAEQRAELRNRMEVLKHRIAKAREGLQTSEKQQKAIREQLDKAGQIEFTEEEKNVLKQIVESGVLSEEQLESIGTTMKTGFRPTANGLKAIAPLTGSASQLTPKQADVIKKILDHGKQPPTLTDFPLMDADWIDVVSNSFYQIILSSPVTHARNLIGNESNLALENLVNTVVDRDLRPVLHSIMSAKDGITNMKEAWKHSEAYMKKYNLDVNSRIMKKFTLITRALAAEDAFYYSRNYAAQIASIAIAESRRTGRSVDYLLANPSLAMIKQAEYEASRGTWNYDPEGVLGYITKAIETGVGMAQHGGKLGKMSALLFKMNVIPFTRVVANVLHTALDWSPVGYVGAIKYATGLVDKEFKLGKGVTIRQRKVWTDEKGNAIKSPFARRDTTRQLARATMGTIMLTLAYMLLEGIISGSGEDDWEKRKQLMETGWRPNSIKIGGRWHSYMMLPIAPMLSAIANFQDRRRKPGARAEEVLAATVMGTLNTILDQSFLSNLAQLMEAITGNNPRYLIRAAADTPTRVIPLSPNLIRVIVDAYNDKAYAPETFIQYLMYSGRPWTNGWIREYIPARIDVFGREAKKTSAARDLPGSPVMDGQPLYVYDKNDIPYDMRSVLNTVLDAGLKIPSTNAYEAKVGDDQFIKLRGFDKEQFLRQRGFYMSMGLLSYQDDIDELAKEGEIDALDNLLRKIASRATRDAKMEMIYRYHDGEMRHKYAPYSKTKDRIENETN